MFTFSDYKALPKDIRSTATKYWAEVVKKRLGALSPNEVLAAHLNSSETSISGWSNNKSRYWNRALRGQPVSRESNIDRTEALLPGTKFLLQHPIWQILSSFNYDESLYNKALLSLMPSIRDKLYIFDSLGSFARQRHYPRSLENFFRSHTSLDALTCLIILGLEARHNKSELAQVRLKIGIMKQFYSLATSTEFEYVSETVFRHTSELFNQTRKDLNRISIFDFQTIAPCRILPHEKVDINTAINCYQVLLSLAIDKGYVSDNSEEKVKFLNSIDPWSIGDTLMLLME